MPIREIEDRDAMVEKIEYVIDVTNDTIYEVLWSRALPDGWILYGEKYIAGAPPPLGSALVRRELLTMDALIARILFDGLASKIK